jgi:hypothetical protein
MDRSGESHILLMVSEYLLERQKPKVYIVVETIGRGESAGVSAFKLR